MEAVVHRGLPLGLPPARSPGPRGAGRRGPARRSPRCVVVPPHAAAMVPDAKSSADVVSPYGMSRWVCTSTPPGMTYSPGGVVRPVGVRREARGRPATMLLAVDQDVGGAAPVRGDDGAVADQRAHRRGCSMGWRDSGTRPSCSTEGGLPSGRAHAPRIAIPAPARGRRGREYY